MTPPESHQHTLPHCSPLRSSHQKTFFPELHGATVAPAVVGYLGGYCEPSLKRCAWLSSWFAVGLVTATALLGLVVVLVGGIFGGVHPVVRYILAVVPISMGLHLLGVITIKVPTIGNWRPIRTGTLGAFLTGLVFSLQRKT